MITITPIDTIPVLGTEFKKAKSQNTTTKKRRPPLSVRLSDEQWEQFKQDSIGMSMNAYALSRLFDEDSKPKRRCRKSTKQDKAIASALRRMGGCGIKTYLMSQILAVEEGRLYLSREDQKELRAALAEFEAIRSDLIAAVGLDTGT